MKTLKGNASEAICFQTGMNNSHLADSDLLSCLCLARPNCQDDDDDDSVSLGAEGAAGSREEEYVSKKEESCFFLVGRKERREVNRLMHDNQLCACC